ncbi:hypothetical protein D0864_12141, partial [Hortaea werneckii]
RVSAVGEAASAGFPLLKQLQYVEYIRGTATNDECEPLFQQYKTCLSKALKDRGIDQMLEEARADNKENDIEYMKPNGR